MSSPEPGASRLHRLPPMPRTRGADHDLSRLFEDDPTDLRWFSVDEAAALCRRSPSTIRNLLSAHQCRVRKAWVVRRRLRKRIILMSPGVCRWLQAITLFRRKDVLEFPPR